MIALTPGTAVASAIAAVEHVLGPDTTVLTHDQRAAQSAAQLTGSTDVLTGVVLAFAAVSLLVASLVIANTFQVLIAQRTRTLALLRCVGADRRQLRRSVLLEASIVGLAASATGVLLGIGLVQAALTILGRTTDVPLPSTVSITVAVVLVPLVVGTAVTLLASLAPARAATRVSPLAALRPVDPSVRDRAGRVRAVFSALMVVGGAALLALGMALSTRTDVLVALGGGHARRRDLVLRRRARRRLLGARTARQERPAAGPWGRRAPGRRERRAQPATGRDHQRRPVHRRDPRGDDGHRRGQRDPRVHRRPGGELPGRRDRGERPSGPGTRHRCPRAWRTRSPAWPG